MKKILALIGIVLSIMALSSSVSASLDATLTIDISDKTVVYVIDTNLINIYHQLAPDKFSGKDININTLDPKVTIVGQTTEYSIKDVIKRISIADSQIKIFFDIDVVREYLETQVSGAVVEGTIITGMVGTDQFTAHSGAFAWSRR